MTFTKCPRCGRGSQQALYKCCKCSAIFCRFEWPMQKNPRLDTFWGKYLGAPEWVPREGICPECGHDVLLTVGRVRRPERS